MADEVKVPEEDQEKGPVHNPEWYFDNSKGLFKVLRWLNLLEPDRCVLSITKILLWGTTLQSILVIAASNSGLNNIIGAIGLNAAAMFKHESRRKEQNNNGS